MIMILKIAPILSNINFESSMKLTNANMGNVSTVLNRIADAIQKAGNLARAGASAF